MLEPHAYGICNGRRQVPGYTIVFHYAAGKMPDRARAVTMTLELTELRVEHVAFSPDVMVRQEHGCPPLKAKGRSLFAGQNLTLQLSWVGVPS